MKLFYNKATRVLGTSPTSTTNVGNIRVKRYEDVTLELVPVDAAGEVEPWSGTVSGICVVKKAGDFAGAAVLLDMEWTEPTTAGAGYLFEFLAAGTSIDAELAALPERAFALEFFVEVNGKRLPLPSVGLIIENNYWREDEVPEDPENPYPLPANLITLGNARGTVRITASGLELKDTATNTWRRIEFVNGELTFTTIP